MDHLMSVRELKNAMDLAPFEGERNTQPGLRALLRAAEHKSPRHRGDRSFLQRRQGAAPGKTA